MRNTTRSFLLAIVLGTVACDALPTATPTPSGSSPVASGAIPSAAAFVPTFEAAECPQDIRDVTVVPIACGHLTVLEDRGSAGSRHLRLLVSKIEPQHVAAAPDPMIVLADIRTGGYPDYGGLVEIANRVSRVVYIVDPRGRAHSDPLLDCPEVVSASPTLVGLRLADPAHASTLGQAVRACRGRLEQAGINTAAYGPDDLIADIHDLRTALGIGEWNAIAYGPASELAFAIDGPDRSALRSITLDSPTLGQDDWRTLGPAALDLAIERVATACEAAPACDATTPDVAGAIEIAVAALEAEPVELDVDGTPEAILLGHPIPIVIDGVALLRWIRAQVGRQRPDGEMILTTVAKATEGTLSGTDLIAVQLSGDLGDCLGTLPRCDVGVAWGSIYSLVCSGEIGPAAAGRLAADIGGRDPYATLFSPGPLGIACDAWAAAGEAIAPITTPATPTVIFRGAFDPFTTTPDQMRKVLGSNGQVHVVEIPNGSSNVLGAYECVRSIRNAWVVSPDRPPGETSCVDDLPAINLPH